MSALGAAISGLQSSQKWLDVISNNVSNSNTVAYKAGRLTFADLISEGLRSASGPNNTSNLGGINPNQVGLGVTVGSVQTIMKQGALQTTGNVTDIAINGTGFLTVEKGSQTLYTRAGNLTFDQQGNLVTTDGGIVQGWSITYTRTPTGGTPIATVTGPTLDTTNTSTIGPIQIPNTLVLAPKQTSNQLNPTIKDEGIILKGNLDVNTAVNPNAGAPLAAGYVPDATLSATVYDSLGTAYPIVFYFDKTALTGAWTWTAFNQTGGLTPATGAPQVGTGNITFDTDGSLLSNGTPGNNPAITLPAAQLVDGAIAPLVISVNFGTDATASASGQGLRDGLTGDFGNGTTDSLGVYTPVQTIYTSFVDGYSEGSLQGLSFNQSGGIDASFSNGQTIEVAKLALTRFDNQDGLTRIGGNYFQKTANTGLGQIGTAGAAGFGTVQGSALEASNVDLTVELTNMILAQRMFESNARVVTASDRVLDTLVNLGR